MKMSVHKISVCLVAMDLFLLSFHIDFATVDLSV